MNDAGSAFEEIEAFHFGISSRVVPAKRDIRQRVLRCLVHGLLYGGVIPGFDGIL